MKNTKQKKPGYKNTPLGWVPEDWEVKTIIECADYVDYRGKSPIKSESGYFLVTARNIKDGYIDYENSKEYVPIEEYTKVMGRGKPLIGDVLITTEAPLGNVASIDREDIALAQRVIKYRGKPNIVRNGYLKYYLLSPKFQQLLKEKSTGSTAKGIKGSTLHKLHIAFPKQSEQDKIAALFESSDKIIQQLKSRITNLEARKQALMQQLLSGKKRFKEFRKMEWKTKKLAAVANEVSIKNRDNTDLVVLSCTKYEGLVESLKYFGRKVYSDDLSTYKVVLKGHFAYATNHIEEGSIGYQKDYNEALISPMYTVFQTTEGINDEFLFKVLKSTAYIHEYKRRMEGSIDRRGGLRWDSFSKITVPCPSPEEQQKIASVLNKADEEINNYKQLLTQYQKQKKGLMQVLLTGKVRVKV